MNPEREFDVVVVGGGIAGLAAAVALGRSLRRVLVIDSGEPRNATSPSAHNLLGHEGIAPRTLLADGRREALSYGVEIRDDTVLTARPGADGVVVVDSLSGGRAHARQLVLAQGVRDELPAIDGLRAFWGTSVLHCPYCHGWEVRGKRIGVIATGSNASHQAHLFRQLSDDVTVVLHDAPAPTDDERRRFDARGIRVVDSRILRVRHDGDALTGVELDDGTELPFDALVVAPRATARGELFEQLGGTLSEHPMGRMIAADEMGATAIPGVWSAGNGTDPAATLAVAAAAGMRVGARVNAELVEQDVRAALVAWGDRAATAW
ncbi:thioredoxin reductase [Herbiconiux sp. L3-i23]|nr:thioredoxin reductase [Herbiconiux sp. L3-i23]